MEQDTQLDQDPTLDRTTESTATEKIRAAAWSLSARRSNLRLSQRSADPDPEKEKEDQKNAKAPKAVFMDADSMRAKIRAEATKEPYDVSKFYKTHGTCQWIARHPVFEKMTLSVIAFNALWISIDTDGNNADMLLNAEPVYQIAEHFFCIYFAFEWWVRYRSFRRKRDGLRDAWFVFDSSLVLMMVLETWVMTAFMLAMGGGGGAGLGNASILRMARLLRLSRMARMARLFRAMPELLILIKGMAAATRSVFFTLALLLIIVYVFGIAFRQLTADTKNKEVYDYFHSVPASMHTLLLQGTILDSPGAVVDALSLEETSWLLIPLFYFLVLLAALTVMNMLIGVLCEVVSAVAVTERETLAVTFVKGQLQKVMNEVNDDGDDKISKREFANIINNDAACHALQEVGVDVAGLIENIDIIFAKDNDEDEEEEKVLSFEDFMGTILRLRGDNYATVKDVVDLRKYITNLNHRLRDDLRSQHDLKNKLNQMQGRLDRKEKSEPDLHSRDVKTVSKAHHPVPPVNSSHVSNSLANDGFGGQIVANDSIQKHTNNYANNIHIQQTVLTMGPTANQGGPSASLEESPPPMWPVDANAKTEDTNLWMRRARLVESLAMAQMELSRFVESLPPGELCAQGTPRELVDSAVLPGQADGLGLPGLTDDYLQLGSVPGGAMTPDGMSAICSRWSQREMQSLKGQMGNLQEALLSGLSSLQRERVRDLCYPQLTPGWQQPGSISALRGIADPLHDDRRPTTRRTPMPQASSWMAQAARS